MAEDYANANGLQIIGYYHFEANLPPRPVPPATAKITTTTTTTSKDEIIPTQIISSFSSSACGSSSSSFTSNRLSTQCLVVADKLHALCGDRCAVVFTADHSHLLSCSSHCIQGMRRGSGSSWIPLLDVLVPRHGIDLTRKLLSTGGHLKVADLDDHLCNTSLDPINSSLLLLLQHEGCQQQQQQESKQKDELIKVSRPSSADKEIDDLCAALRAATA
eukprot:GHVS01039059.1.p1 GENE.GHVS01039059.1~~GHVS01039059.1.p1  ORF type:complete len:227 (-),score=46.45 GHVS01039059.1:63-716(-)